MATLNQTELMRELERITSAPDPQSFIYDFLTAFKLPKATITQLRNGGARNVAPAGTDDVAMKNGVWFRAVSGADVFSEAERMAADEHTVRQKLRFVIVTDYQDLVAYDLKASDRMECVFSDLPRHYSFFLPLAGFEKAQTHTEAQADVKAAAKMGRLCDMICEQNEVETPEQIHALNVFLSRLLFCLYAEDTGIFEGYPERPVGFECRRLAP